MIESSTHAGSSAQGLQQEGGSRKRKRTRSGREGTAFQRSVRPCLSTEEDEFFNPRLEIRRSQISCERGAGLGVFSRSVADSDQPVFKQGEPILTIRGPLALRKVMDEDGKSLEWLYDNNRCCGLNSSGRIVWFCERLWLNKSSSVEVGCWPTNLAAFANDTGGESTNIKLEIDKKILPRVTARGRKAKASDIPVCRMIATKDIPPGVELCWSYGRDNKDETDYSGSYQQRYDGTDEQNKIIANSTQRVIKGARKVVLYKDVKEFHRQVWKDALEPKKYEATYSDQELKWVNLKNTKYLVRVSDAVKNEHALKAYVKSFLAKGSDIASGVNNIQHSLLNYKMRYPKVPKRALKGMDESRASVFQFCIDKGILTPESHLSFPLGWLTKKLSANPEDVSLRQLLVLKLRFEIASKDVSPVRLCTQLNKDNVPNFVYPEKEWKELHIETVTGVVASCFYAEGETEALLQQYKELPRHIVGMNKIPVISAARRGDHDMTVENVRRHLESKQTCGETVKLLKSAGLQLIVNRQLIEPTVDNLIAFARENFSPDFCKEHLGVKFLSDEELIEKASVSSVRTEFVDEIKRRIADRNDTTLLKKYLEMTYKKRMRKSPFYLLEVFGKTHFLDKPVNEYTDSDLLDLFKDEDAPWLDEIYPDRQFEGKSYSVHELINMLEKLRRENKYNCKLGHALQSKILERCKNSYETLCLFARYRFTVSEAKTNKSRNGAFKRLLDANGIVKANHEAYSYVEISEKFGSLPRYVFPFDEPADSQSFSPGPSAPRTEI